MQQPKHAPGDYVRTVADKFGWLRAVLTCSPRPGVYDLAAAIAIASHYSLKRGAAWPSLATISSWCGVEKRNVNRALKRLEMAGFLEVAGRGGPHESRTYRLKLPPAVFPGTPEHEGKRNANEANRNARSRGRARSADAPRRAPRGGQIVF